jgi:hypothetical protein
MSAIDDGGPAFPHIDSGCGRFEEGMTLRDYFAAKAMQALITGLISKPEREEDWLESELWAPQQAYVVADAMLDARKERP